MSELLRQQIGQTVQINLNMFARHGAFDEAGATERVSASLRDPAGSNCRRPYKISSMDHPALCRLPMCAPHCSMYSWRRRCNPKFHTVRVLVLRTKLARPCRSLGTTSAAPPSSILFLHRVSRNERRPPCIVLLAASRSYNCPRVRDH